jgi:hypothetical protein
VEQFCCKGDKSNQITAINETWARTYKPEVNESPPKGVFHSRLENKFQQGHCEYTILPAISAIPPMRAVRELCPRPVEKAITQDNSTTNSGHTIEKILQHLSGKCYSTFPVLSISVHVSRVSSPYKSSHCVGNNLQTEKASEEQLGAKWNISISGDPIGVCQLAHHWQQTVNSIRN